MSNIVDCDMAERESMWFCHGGNTLGVLKQVQRAYEERLELIERNGGSQKIQLEVEVLRSWVSDLSGQNALLARTVEDLETDVTTKILLERRKHEEIVSELQAERCALGRRLRRSEADVRGLLEVLRRLRDLDRCTTDGIHFYEVTQSDIFGSVQGDCQENHLDQGDHTRTSSRNTLKLKRSRNLRHS